MKIEMRLGTFLILIGFVVAVVWYFASLNSRVKSNETQLAGTESRCEELDSRVAKLELTNIQREERWKVLKSIGGFFQRSLKLA